MTSPQKIPNLQWTDIAASMLVGTRSRLGPSSSASNTTTSAPGQVLKAEKGVSYKYQYGVLGFLCCVLWLGCAALCVVMFTFPNFRYAISLSKVITLTNALCVGRTVALVVAPELSADSMVLSSKEWFQEAGKTRIVILGEGDEVLIAEPIQDPETGSLMRETRA